METLWQKTWLKICLWIKNGTYHVSGMYTFFDRWTEPGRMNSNKSTKLRGVHHFHHHHHYHHHHHRHDNHHYVLCRPTGVKPRLDCQARKQFGRIHFGVFSMSCFVPPALSSDLTCFVIRHLSLTGGVPTNWK